MRSHGNHRGLRGQPCPGRDLRQQRAYGFARLDDGREQVFGQAECPEEFGGPLPRDGVEKPGGGSIRGLGTALPRQFERNKVRNQQSLDAAQFTLRGELVDGIELQELQTRGGIEPRRVQDLVDVRDGGAAALVAVAERLGPQDTRGIHESVVDGPRVDPDTGDPLPACGGRFGGRRKSREHLTEQGVEVPVESAVELHDAVGETVHRFQRDRFSGRGAAGDPAEHDAPRGRSDIDGGENAAGTGLSVHRRKAAATPASTGMCRPVVCESSLLVSTAAALATCSGRTSRLSRVRWA
ncbi:hypothetical protein AHiyo8_05410 [Arthrobacter sp. Hiyo8]|nr:hypothetical protein AHiyo8_05410 [Arthrobacter sp. Hiyo8]